MSAVVEFEPGPRSMAVPFDPAWMRSMLAPDLAGVYVLIEGDKPIYVGRSDTCLLRRLVAHEHRVRSSHVVWALRPDPVHAYLAECHWYHRLGGREMLINERHPASPRPGVRCPFCDAPLAEARAAIANLAAIANDGGPGETVAGRAA